MKISPGLINGILQFRFKFKKHKIPHYRILLPFYSLMDINKILPVPLSVSYSLDGEVIYPSKSNLKNMIPLNGLVGERGQKPWVMNIVAITYIRYF